MTREYDNLHDPWIFVLFLAVLFYFCAQLCSQLIEFLFLWKEVC